MADNEFFNVDFLSVQLILYRLNAN